MEQEAIALAMGALADIAFSDDMTFKVARSKAKRVYEQLSRASAESEQKATERDAADAARQIAVEFGYRCCEKGMNLQAAIDAAMKDAK